MECSALNLRKFAEQYVSLHPEVDFFVFGHLHLARVAALDDSRQIVFLGDWISHDTYAVFDGSEMKLKSFSEN